MINYRDSLSYSRDKKIFIIKNNTYNKDLINNYEYVFIQENGDDLIKKIVQEKSV